MASLEKYFQPFRNDIIGIDTRVTTPYGNYKMIYADWIASGRLYGSIENIMRDKLGPFIGNTHTETTETGTRMTHSYKLAHKIIKNDVNASDEDVIITAGFGMTALVNKFLRILGLKIPEQFKGVINLPKEERPVVFITHMEHHSNQISWNETIADVVVLPPNKDMLADPEILRKEIKKYSHRKTKIGAFTACSNVTGIETPFYELAKIMHQNGGICCIDFAASAPYITINMHPPDPEKKLDTIYFSPHKFLGGPGSSGVLIFDSALYKLSVPDHPGGGTVEWTNPWGEIRYIKDIETREDGGTPGFLQAIRAALAVQLKNKMGVDNIKIRKSELLKIAFEGLEKIPGIQILADNVRERQGVISFYFKDIHFSLIVKLLNDRFGIQIRSGCVCAGTYGHFLLNITRKRSKQIIDKIDKGDLAEKLGWVRLSIHPTMKNDELNFIIKAIREIVENHKVWKKDYIYKKETNEFTHKDFGYKNLEEINSWFEM